MYRLQLLHGDVWSILDEREEEVFQGSLSGCESWLDSQENRVAQSSASRSRAGLANWLRRLWSDRKAWPSLHHSRSASGAGHLPHHP